MRKVRKDRIMLVAIIAVVLIAVIALIIINPFKKPGVIEEPEPQIYVLPDTTYSNMEVKDVEMEYLKDNDETMVSMIIDNTTQETVVEDDFDTIWVNADGEVIGQVETYIDQLAPGEQISVSVILPGDLRATAAIKLQEK